MFPFLFFKDLRGQLICLQTWKASFQSVVNVTRLQTKSCSLATWRAKTRSTACRCRREWATSETRSACSTWTRPPRCRVREWVSVPRCLFSQRVTWVLCGLSKSQDVCRGCSVKKSFILKFSRNKTRENHYFPLEFIISQPPSSIWSVRSELDSQPVPSLMLGMQRLKHSSPRRREDR